MSLKTWQKEFYSIPADEVEKEAAIKHSLKKWQGLLHLDEHDIEINWGKLHDETEHLAIDSGSCALCECFTCGKCPLKNILGKRCDAGNLSPYRIWLETKNPQPMIAALEKCLNS